MRSARRLAPLGARAAPAARGRRRSRSSRSGASLVDLDRAQPAACRRARRPPRRVPPGEIRIRVRNPQRERSTIALGDRRRRDRAVPRRRAARARPAALEHDRRPVRLGRGRSDRRRRHQLDRHPDDEGDRRRRRDAERLGRGFLGYAIIGFLVGVRPRRARPAVAPVAAARQPALAGRVHGADRRPAHVPRDRGAVRGVRAAGGAARPLGGPGPRARSVSSRQLPRDHLPLVAARRAAKARRSGGRARDARRGRHRPAQPRRGPRDRLVLRARRARSSARS